MSYLPAARFSKIIGEVSHNGSSYWICKEHGNVTELVPFFQRYENNLLSWVPNWSCPKCLVEHFNKGPVLEAKEKSRCAICKGDKDVTICTACEETVCRSHLTRGVCDECLQYDETIRGYFGI